MVPPGGYRGRLNIPAEELRGNYGTASLPMLRGGFILSLLAMRANPA